ncbi:2'-deoxynucleoside 5'-phosphate N-hydrolase 1-like isoform X2 [Amphibalanus amphitrite]|nr:2'-deoxynucleoside 5'-phosphate N-hydrolase 1-like isoform X2 [Amphibalanus amphitrite]XP_043188350.1 2'-deoxynucleoside 5'-phosphate N-hydrolase 1-like isoform X2 [Amphibalanus amphitrite]XP_043188351.1 2'-deoxynucleoside 5'-phosphate N-hydrolase 1-like isoform X2 [Amphibalanus amphitrite]XP_043188353.1 2'-deoxynucleoside 5'-phosphate N-hydrolase 1-like isoform X2 [Amphibalanus amphitrite]
MSRQIYFCGSIRGGRQDVDLYGRLVAALRRYGTVLTEFVADPKVTDMGSNEGTATTDREIHDRDVRLLEECDTIVAEVTQPSLGVGYEIGRGIAMGGRRVLCLYRPQPDKRLSAMIRGLPPSKDIQVVDYSADSFEQVLSDFFSAA